MSELKNRMIEDLQLAGLAEGTKQEYLRAVRQLAAYYMVPPDQLTQRQVQDYILYVRDDLGVAMRAIKVFDTPANEVIDGMRLATR